MDELLHEPRRLGEAGADLPLGKKLRGFAEALQEKTALAWEGAQPKLRVARKWLSEHPISPLVYLAVATAVGVGAVVSAVYSPCYVVNVDGVDIGAPIPLTEPPFYAWANQPGLEYSPLCGFMANDRLQITNLYGEPVGGDTLYAIGEIILRAHEGNEYMIGLSISSNIAFGLVLGKQVAQLADWE